MRYVTARLSSARGSRFNQSERRSSSVWWPIRAGVECRPIGAVLPACNARRYRWQYKRPAPSFLTLSFNDAVWSGAKTRPSSGMTSQRWHPVTGAWPISRSGWLIDLTYIQVRVIDWYVTVLVTGHLAADGGTSGVTSHGDVTDTTSGDVTGSTSYHVTHSRPIRSLKNIQNGCHLAADGWTDCNMETIRNGDVTGSTSYHVTPSRPIRSLENIHNGELQAALYTTIMKLSCLYAQTMYPEKFRSFCRKIASPDTILESKTW